MCACASLVLEEPGAKPDIYIPLPIYIEYNYFLFNALILLWYTANPIPMPALTAPVKVFERKAATDDAHADLRGWLDSTMRDICGSAMLRVHLTSLASPIYMQFVYMGLYSSNWILRMTANGAQRKCTDVR